MISMISPKPLKLGRQPHQWSNTSQNKLLCDMDHQQAVKIIRCTMPCVPTHLIKISFHPQYSRVNKCLMQRPIRLLGYQAKPDHLHATTVIKWASCHIYIVLYSSVFKYSRKLKISGSNTNPNDKKTVIKCHQYFICNIRRSELNGMHKL